MLQFQNISYKLRVSNFRSHRLQTIVDYMGSKVSHMQRTNTGQFSARIVVKPRNNNELFQEGGYLLPRQMRCLTTQLILLRKLCFEISPEMLQQCLRINYSFVACNSPQLSILSANQSVTYENLLLETVKTIGPNDFF